MDVHFQINIHVRYSIYTATIINGTKNGAISSSYCKKRKIYNLRSRINRVFVRTPFTAGRALVQCALRFLEKVIYVIAPALHITDLTQLKAKAPKGLDIAVLFLRQRQIEIIFAQKKIVQALTVFRDLSLALKN